MRPTNANEETGTPRENDLMEHDKNSTARVKVGMEFIVVEDPNIHHEHQGDNCGQDL